MRYLKYIVFGLGTAIGVIAYRSIEDGRIAAIALIAVIIVTAIVTTIVENRTGEK